MELPITAKEIPGTKDWIDTDGSVYTINTKLKISKKKSHVIENRERVAVYDCDSKTTKSTAVHRLVAEVFIPNPEPVKNPRVIHIDGNQLNNNVENLKWTVSRGSAKYSKEENIRRPEPVNIIDRSKNKIIKRFDSVTKGSDYLRSIKNPGKDGQYSDTHRYDLVRESDMCFINKDVVGRFDYKTDKLLDTYPNISIASRDTGEPKSNVIHDCKYGKRSKTYHDVYFKLIKYREK